MLAPKYSMCPDPHANTQVFQTPASTHTSWRIGRDRFTSPGSAPPKPRPMTPKSTYPTGLEPQVQSKQRYGHKFYPHVG